MSEPESLGNVIARGRRPSAKKKKQKLDMVALEWKHIAGVRLAAHSAPTGLSRGTLNVAADGPSWASEISIETAALLQKIAGVLGDGSIRKVRVRARFKEGESGEGAAPTEAEEVAEQAGGLGEDVARGLESIEGEDVRGALEGMLRASVASKQSKQNGQAG